jgi:crotonobetainyl-CoA:carnitine CoA-transferase CaiB-like acyl-CoA transferase
VDKALASDQVAARDMVIEMQTDTGPVKLLGNPLKFSQTPVSYRRAPPVMGQDSEAVLKQFSKK